MLSAVPPFLSHARNSKPAERRDRSQSACCPSIEGVDAREQPRSQRFSLFVIGKAGKGPGTGRSSMYSDWSMTRHYISRYSTSI